MPLIDGIISIIVKTLSKGSKKIQGIDGICIILWYNQ